MSGNLKRSGYLLELTPLLVGHEIELVHTGEKVQSFMDGETIDLGLSAPWTAHQTGNVANNVAFDDCMFLPAN
ncbi:hypothetical protein B7R21_10560 [Subtercola boreus]|uniref:Uncharacterized protein n=1 Tax=Subtercola boreus TaxID=120213 RepID=A0A3E0VT27_9MICO|nr:hypothetical protein [Subtercola boreus]RFA12760.1 hypothetical protein B7R21_10560 [Subtercola boreus]